MTDSSNKNLVFVLIIIGIVILAFLGLIVGKDLSSNPNPSTSSAPLNTTGSSPAPTAVTQALSTISQSTLDSVGIGTAASRPIPIKAPALSQNGLPEILYEGAEFCPFCATERWPMAVALSQFGTFSNLGVTHSSSTDVYPNTQTLSFYQSTYTSKYITFVPIEFATNIPNGSGSYTTLQVPTSSENKIINTYDATPYLPASAANSIPFIDFAGHYLIAGATYSPSVLQGHSATDIAQSLNDPTSPIAKGADGAANIIIATICKLTANQPTTVCNPTIQNIENSVL